MCENLENKTGEYNFCFECGEIIEATKFFCSECYKSELNKLNTIKE